jgi:hypothetical protein
MPTYRATVDLRFPVGSGGGTNTWHFRTDNPIGIEDEPSTIMGWVEDFYSAASGLMPTTWSAAWDGTVLEVGVSDPEFTAPRTGWSVAGTDSGSNYGAAAGMACVTWRSSVASRSGRGRTFLGPIAATQVQIDGTLSADALTELRAAAAALVSQSNTNDGVGALGVYSRTDLVIRDFVGATVTDQVAILRSRRG